MTRLTDVGGFFGHHARLNFLCDGHVCVCAGHPERNALAAAFVTTSFTAPEATFPGDAIFAQKHGITTEIRGAKSLYYPGVLTERFETMFTLCLMCVFPAWFPVVAVVCGIMCWIAGGRRIAAAVQTFGDRG